MGQCAWCVCVYVCQLTDMGAVAVAIQCRIECAKGKIRAQGGGDGLCVFGQGACIQRGTGHVGVECVAQAGAVLAG